MLSPSFLYKIGLNALLIGHLALYPYRKGGESIKYPKHVTTTGNSSFCPVMLLNGFFLLL